MRPRGSFSFLRDGGKLRLESGAAGARVQPSQRHLARFQENARASLDSLIPRAPTLLCSGLDLRAHAAVDAQADRRTHGGVEEERDGLSEEKRALLPSPATTEPQMDGGLRFRIRHSVARGPCWGGEGVWGGGCGLLVASQTDRAAALNAAAASFVSVFSHNTPSSSPLPLPLLCSSAGLYA